MTALWPVWLGAVLGVIILAWGFIVFARECVRGWRKLAAIRQQAATDPGEIGDDALNTVCRHCNGEYMYRCTCASDCGYAWCDWKFEQELAALLRHADEIGPA